MSESQRDFTTYEPGDNPAELAGGVLRDIADAVEFDLGDEPSEQVFRDFVAAVAPSEQLRNNIGRVSGRLGEDARETMSRWVEQSGILKSVDRAFADPSVDRPNQYDFTILNYDGVVNASLTRRDTVERLDPAKSGELLVVVGGRLVKPAEHQLAATINRERRLAEGLLEEKDEVLPEDEEERKKAIEARKKHYPTSVEFAKQLLVVEGLRAAGFMANLIETDATKGRDVADAIIAQRPDILEGTTLSIGQAPATIQGTGQLLDAAKRKHSDYNNEGSQLFMKGGTRPVARNGEPAYSHQNSETALGHMARAAIYIDRNKKS